jgi:hypothetical protein
MAGNVMHSKLRDRLVSVETRGRKKVHRNVMNAAGKIDTSALLGLLRGWLFNYNTVEAIMIFSAVIVALMGIMYSAQNSSNSFFDSARRAVTVVVIGVVSVSIVYFFTVVAVEIHVLASEENRRKMLAKGRNKKGKDADLAKKDKAAVANSLGDEGTAKMMGPVSATMNPMFSSASSSSMNQASIQEAILQERRPPSVELWKMFQSSFIGLQEDMDLLSRQLAEAKLQQQKLEAAQAMLANVGINVAIPEGGKTPVAAIKKARQEFAPSLAGEGSKSPAMKLARTRSANFKAGASGAASPGLKLGALRNKTPTRDTNDDDNL